MKKNKKCNLSSDELEILKRLILDDIPYGIIHKKYFPTREYHALNYYYRKLKADLITHNWSSQKIEYLKLIYDNYDTIEELSEELDEPIAEINYYIKEINKTILFCVECGEKIGNNTERLCKDCKEQKELEREVKKRILEKQQYNDKKIQLYKERNKHKLSYCESCKEEKDVNNDYYYSVKSDGTVWCFCKKCNKKRNMKNKLKNLEERGF